MVGKAESNSAPDRAAGLQPACRAPRLTLPPYDWCAPWSDRTTVASLPKTFPAIERMGLAERPVFETETRGLDPVSNRSQCACLLARSGLAEGGGIEPLTCAVTLVFRTSRQPSSGAFHWYPCADSNREPPRSKRGTSTRLGYRGELVRAVGFEPTLPRLSTSCLPPTDWATRAWCGSSDSNRD